MNAKNGLMSALILAMLMQCTFNSVSASPVSKFMLYTHSNYAIDTPEARQTYLLVTFNDGMPVSTKVGWSVYLHGVLSADTPPVSWRDSSHGIPNATINIQYLNPVDNTWITINTTSTNPPNKYPTGAGTFTVILTPETAGTSTYRATYDGDSQYASAISNITTLDAGYY